MTFILKDTSDVPSLRALSFEVIKKHNSLLTYQKQNMFLSIFNNKNYSFKKNINVKKTNQASYPVYVCVYIVVNNFTNSFQNFF